MKRMFDLALVVSTSLLLMPIALIVFLLVKITSNGPALYWSQRVGVDNHLFSMPKFRSMKVDTPVIATHEMNMKTNPSQYLTSVGAFIRKTSLDEIPQLWSVLKGDMSIVGPRPALYNQDDLVKLRTESGIHLLKPGITGWAQVNGRDEVSIPTKVLLDAEYLRRQSFKLDCYIILLTVFKVLNRDDVLH